MDYCCSGLLPGVGELCIKERVGDGVGVFWARAWGEYYRGRNT